MNTIKCWNQVEIQQCQSTENEILKQTQSVYTGICMEKEVQKYTLITLLILC